MDIIIIVIILVICCCCCIIVGGGYYYINYIAPNNTQGLLSPSSNTSAPSSSGNTSTPSSSGNTSGPSSGSNTSTQAPTTSTTSAPTTTPEIKIPKFIIRTGGSQWAKLIQDSNETTTNIQSWNPDIQYKNLGYAKVNQIAVQFRYFAEFWLKKLIKTLVQLMFMWVH